MKIIIRKSSHGLAQDALCTILEEQSKKDKHHHDVDMIKLLKYIVKYKKLDFRDRSIDKDSMVVDSQ